MSFLTVPGARLYYETRGSGPLLLMIPGANGVADGFRAVSEHLAADYTVLLYDRRGFSRSTLEGSSNGDRLETDADDVRRLIEHIGLGPAVVFGASSGAIVALKVLTRHPAVVRTLVPFEPPAVRQLADGRRWLDFFDEIYDVYRDSGIEPAPQRFRKQAFAESDRMVMVRAPRNTANAIHWFEHELRQYPPVELDVPALSANSDRIVLAVGRESTGYPACDVNVVLGEKLQRRVVELPGGHVGFVSRPAEFAAGLRSALQPNPGSFTSRQWDEAYAGRPHWDLGRPQSAFRTLADSGAIRGRVLDLGCGTGEHVLMAAALGLDATGIDFAATPLRIAAEHARDRSLKARFLQHDARKIAELGEAYDTVLDSGLFHIFGDDDRMAYVDAVRSVLRSGGRFFLLCFSDRQPGDEGPRRITRQEIETTFVNGWQVDSITATTLDMPTDPDGLHGWLVTVTRI